jgi:formylglycine-generating enzyme required for sulfatase activity
MTYDLFISHSSADAGAALDLVNEIESRGILKCWVAPRDIPIGASYQREIVRAIRNCGGFVLLLSGNANESDHVLRELELAAQAKKAIYPIKIDESDPAEGIKYYLASTQWVERKAYGNRLVEIIEQMVASAQGIGGGVERPPAPPTPHAPPPKPKPRISPILIGVVAAVLLLLVGGGIVAWQQIEARRVAQELKIKHEQEVLETARRDEERLGKERKEQARKEEAARQEQAKKEEEARKEEQARKDAEAKKDEEAARQARIKESLGVAKLPFKKAGAPEIQKAAPTVGDAVPGKTFFRECDICPVMAVIPAGGNIIGSPDDERGHTRNEAPQQGVVFRVPLAVGRSEVAFEEYLACIAEGGCRPERPADRGWGYEKQPAIFVSWDDAQRYVTWLSQKTKAKYRLLSEAEWEYAARGCAKVCGSTPFWFGDDISKARANYNWRIAYLGAETALPLMRTMPIDEAEANPFGLLHVHGNVAEWVEDCWNESLAGMTRDGTARTSGDCTRRVVRGGSWKEGPQDLRSAKRSWELATERSERIGFRVARELKL